MIMHYWEYRPDLGTRLDKLGRVPFTVFSLVSIPNVGREDYGNS